MKIYRTIISLLLTAFIMVRLQWYLAVWQRRRRKNKPLMYEEGQVPILIVKPSGEKNCEAVCYLWDTKNNRLEKDKPFFKVNRKLLDWGWEGGMLWDGGDSFYYAKNLRFDMKFVTSPDISGVEY